MTGRANRHAEHGRQAAAGRGAEPDRGGDRHLPVDAGAARRPGGLFRRTRRHPGGDRADPREARPRPAALPAIRPLRRRSVARRPRHLADHRPIGRDRDQNTAAGVGRAHAARPHRVDGGRDPARHRRRDPTGLARRSRLPGAGDGRRVAAGVLHRADPHLRALLFAGMGAGAARPPRRLLQPAAARHRLLPDRQLACRQRRSVHGEPQAAGAARAHARHLLAGADRAHDARLHAGRARLRLRAHRARERAFAVHGRRHLCVSQRHGAGGRHARHGILVPARRRRAGREGVRLARHRLVCSGGVDRVRLRAAAGLRADPGGDVRRAQPDHRHPLRSDRPAREDRGMTMALAKDAAPVAAQANGPEPGSSALIAMLRHARYVLSDNAVTGFAFGLFLLIVLAALLGPAIVPYDPLASNTAVALKPPSAAHWFGTDQLGRDVFSRVIVATRLDFIIAVTSVALVFLMGGLAGVAAGFFGGWTDRVVGRIADTIMAFPLFVLAMGIVAALGNTVQNIVLATAIVNFPLYARVARAEANVRREAGFVQAARLSGNGELRIVLGHILPNIMPIMVVQMSLTMGYAILNAAGLSFIGLGVRPPTAEWGIMVAEGAAFMVSGEWWIAFFPGAALMLAVFCFNLLGDGLRDIVDPQRRT